VGAADRSQGLTAADSALARLGLDGGESELRLRKRQPGLGTQTGVPARRGGLEPPRLLVERQQQQRQGIRERDLRKLCRRGPGE
jgi:hypothetical protein